MHRVGLSHCGGALAAFLALVIAVTVGINYVSKQLHSAEDGIEILLVDTALSIGGSGELEASVKKATGVKYVGVATLESDEAEEYVQTVKNYTLSDYLVYLTGSRDAEIIVFPENMLEAVQQMSNIEPGAEVIDVTNAYFTEYEGKMLGIGRIYAALLNGDHREQAALYLNSLR